MKRIIFYITAITFFSSIFSCRKFVEVDIPSHRLLSVSVYKSDATAISALTGIYAKLSDGQSFPSSIPIYTGIYGDDLKNYANSAVYIPYYTNALLAVDNNATNGWWMLFYKLIYESNAIYEGCDQSDKLTPAVKKQLMAEARFIRAFCYFYLTGFWGDVPLALTTDYTVNNSLKKKAISEVYLQIIEDLKYAAENLSPQYVALNSVSAINERIRPNSFAARAMLARLYLYSKQYRLAEEQANLVIGNAAVYNLEPLANVFLKGSKEAIWQLALPTPYNNNNANTLEGYYFILTSKPLPTSTLGTVTLSEELLDSFEPNDNRKTAWVANYSDANVKYPYSFKFKQRASSTTTECSVPLRLSEQYLIRAEARLLNGNLNGAVEDLKVVRQRAGLTSFTATTNEQIIELLLQERRVEFFTEWGHRWLDLKRTGKVDEVMTVISAKKGGVWKSYKSLFPISQQEIQNNRNLTQTPGYQ